MWPYNLLRDAGLREQEDVELVFSILPKSQASVLRMYYERGMDEEEIGRELGVTAGRVEKTRMRALERIRESLSRESSFRESFFKENYFRENCSREKTFPYEPGAGSQRGLRERLRQVKCFVLDMDGTIYLSNRLFPFTKAFLRRLEETGRKYCFFTNNSSKNKQDYVDKLNGMGIAAAPEQVFLSTQVIIEEMQRLHPEDSFYIVGTPNLEDAFRGAGLRVVNGTQKVPESGPAGPGSGEKPGSGEESGPAGPGSGEKPGPGEGSPLSQFLPGLSQKAVLPGGEVRPDVVILGFDTTLTYEKIAKACKYVRHGAAYYGVNMDYNCPVDDGGVIDYIPDCGSIARLVERSTGRFPDFYGKPSRHALEHVIRHTGFAEEELAFVGDRIYTDIAIAKDTKALSIMVLTGETQMEDLEQYDFRPDFILPSLAELTEML